MVHFVALCKLKADLEPKRIEDMMRQTRSRLLRIPEFRTVTCGRRVDPQNDWALFWSADFETLEKMRLAQRTPAYLRFEEEILRPSVRERLELVYEIEPGKDVRYS